MILITHEEFREKLKNSPEKAHRELFETYCNYVYTIVYNRLRSCAVKEDIEVLNEEILKDKWIRWDSISYLIEVNILCRHCSNYALLGMTFTYEDFNKLIVEVKSGDEDGPVINNTLA